MLIVLLYSCIHYIYIEGCIIITYYVHSKMSDSDSDSTDSDNNNMSPYYYHYLQAPRMPSLEPDSESSSIDSSNSDYLPPDASNDV